MAPGTPDLSDPLVPNAMPRKSRGHAAQEPRRQGGRRQGELGRPAGATADEPAAEPEPVVAEAASDASAAAAPARKVSTNSSDQP